MECWRAWTVEFTLSNLFLSNLFLSIWEEQATKTRSNHMPAIKACFLIICVWKSSARDWLILFSCAFHSFSRHRLYFWCIVHSVSIFHCTLFSVRANSYTKPSWNERLSSGAYLIIRSSITARNPICRIFSDYLMPTETLYRSIPWQLLACPSDHTSSCKPGHPIARTSPTRSRL